MVTISIAGATHRSTMLGLCGTPPEPRHSRVPSQRACSLGMGIGCSCTGANSQSIFSGRKITQLAVQKISNNLSTMISIEICIDSHYSHLFTIISWLFDFSSINQACSMSRMISVSGCFWYECIEPMLRHGIPGPPEDFRS